MALEQSPIHRAIWEDDAPLDLFTIDAEPLSPAVRARLDRAIEVVQHRRHDGTLYDVHGVVSDETIAELGEAGYWGLRAGTEYGGAGASFSMLVRAITEMGARGDPWIAGMASTQAALGPVSSLEDFGTPEQKARLLPPLARGERLGAFAVTEPGTSSDWGLLRTIARREGDQLLLTGEKLFITNAAPGRTLTVLCRLDDRLEALIVELPWREDEHFQIVEYDLRAPAHVRNVGLRFRDLPVPAANLLVPHSGDGATIARRALNHGRVAVCAMAAGMLRRFSGNLIPWVQKRMTFGAPIGTRELVERRLGRLAARIVGCDALAAWGAGLLDRGYRGELESVVTKVIGSELLEEATVELLLKTLGARAFLSGNVFADSVHDLLAPTIYEGENELITLGFMNSLSRRHREKVLQPIADAARAAGIDKPDFTDPRQLWALRRSLAPYLTWFATRQARHLARQRLLPGDVEGMTALASQELRGAALEISRLARDPKAAERHTLAHEIATRVQRATTMLVVTRYAARQEDRLVRSAGLCLAQELGQSLTRTRSSAAYRRLVTELGAAVAEDRFPLTEGVEHEPVLMAERLPKFGEPAAVALLH